MGQREQVAVFVLSHGTFLRPRVTLQRQSHGTLSGWVRRGTLSGWVAPLGQARGTSVRRLASGRAATRTGTQGDVPRPAHTCSHAAPTGA